MDDLKRHIIITELKITLCETPELRDLFIDLASKGGFVDPFEWCDEKHIKKSNLGPKGITKFFKMIDSTCSGLVEFQKRSGLIKIFGVPLIRLTDEGEKLAESLRVSKAKMNN